MSYIKVSNVTKVYKDEGNYYLALKNINLEFNKNEFIAILGPSGCGKSTLLNLIMGISEITKGNIYINDESIKSFSKKRMDQYRKKELGIIFQKYNLINLLTSYENIDLVKEKNINRNKIKTLFNKLNLNKKIHSKIKECSGGEIQRIASIRALINNPSILILDEPTGALDEENGIKLMNYINSIKEDKLILFVTHNKELAKKYATRIIEMKDGKVIKDSLNNIKNTNKKDEINTSKTTINLKYKLIYLFNLIFKKKGRFLITILSSTLLLFFLSISIMAINVSKDFIEKSFLSSLDANIINVNSYSLVNKELKENELSSLIINTINKDNRYDLRINYNDHLNNKIKPLLTFNENNKKINLEGISLKCYSKYSNINLLKGSIPSKFNEIIINENLYNYLLNETRIVLNKRFYYDDNYLIIRGVSSSSLLNDSLSIFFNYDFVKEKYKEEKINKYQIDIKNMKDIKEVIKSLENSNLYKNINDINDDSISYSLDYSIDLDNYYVFYDLINLLSVVIYFFLGLSIFISIMLLSNVIYSFNEEEKVNLGLFRILGFSKSSVYSLNIILAIIISLISFILILIINKYLTIELSTYLSNLLNYKVILNIKIYQYFIMILISLILTIISSVLSFIKLKKIKLDNVIKEE